MISCPVVNTIISLLKFLGTEVLFVKPLISHFWNFGEVGFKAMDYSV